MANGDELLAACDEVEALMQEVDRALAEAEGAPDEALFDAMRKHGKAALALNAALRRALDLGLIAAARRGVEERGPYCSWCGNGSDWPCCDRCSPERKAEEGEAR